MKRSSPARRSGRSRLMISQVSAVTPTTTTTTDTIPLARNFPSAIPLQGMTARRDLAHRVLGHRGDREARVDADVGGDRRAVADQQVLVAERAVVAVDHAGLRVLADHRTAENVRGGRDR